MSMDMLTPKRGNHSDELLREVIVIHSMPMLTRTGDKGRTLVSPIKINNTTLKGVEKSSVRHDGDTLEFWELRAVKGPNADIEQQQQITNDE